MKNEKQYQKQLSRLNDLKWEAIKQQRNAQLAQKQSDIASGLARLYLLEPKYMTKSHNCGIIARRKQRVADNAMRKYKNFFGSLAQ